MAVRIYEISWEGLLEKDYGLRDQLRRTALSISSNIAKAMKENPKQNSRDTYLIAKGSCGELRSQLYLANAIKAILKRESEALIQECTEISSMLSGLIRYLRNQQEKSK